MAEMPPNADYKIAEWNAESIRTATENICALTRIANDTADNSDKWPALGNGSRDELQACLELCDGLHRAMCDFADALRRHRIVTKWEKECQ